MKLTKPSASLITEFKWVQAQLPRAEPRKMFGYDALFVNGNLAVGLWQNTCALKLSAADQAKLLARGAAIPFEPMKGRPMTGWLELSEELAHDPEELLAWSERAVAYVATLPPKVRKAAAKDTVAQKTTAKKTTAKKTTAKKTAAKKTTAKKTTAKKTALARRTLRGAD